MTYDDLIQSDSEVQLKWLEGKFTEQANDAEEEVSSYLCNLAWESPIGCYFDFDQSTFDDMTNHPEGYDLGWSLQEHISDMPDERAMAINEGSKLTTEELSATRAIINLAQDESEDGTFCCGFEFEFTDGESCYAVFTGPSLGQGGIDFSFYKIFSDEKTAYEHLKKMGDRWWSL